MAHSAKIVQFAIIIRSICPDQIPSSAGGVGLILVVCQCFEDSSCYIISVMFPRIYTFQTQKRSSVTSCVIKAKDRLSNSWIKSPLSLSSAVSLKFYIKILVLFMELCTVMKKFSKTHIF